MAKKKKDKPLEVKPVEQIDFVLTKKEPGYYFKYVAYILVLATVVTGFVAAIGYNYLRVNDLLPTVSPQRNSLETSIERFKDVNDFLSYLDKTKTLRNAGRAVTSEFRADSSVSITRSAPASASRFSRTNVQVAGIDEPDIVKTDGNKIYYSPVNRYFARPAIEPIFDSEEISIAPSPPQILPSTKIINAFPPTSLAEDSTLDVTGELLLSGNDLVVFSYNKISGFNVADATNPTSSWEIDLDENSIVTSRLLNEKIYVVAQSRINDIRPCPIPLARGGNREIMVSCSSIYYPTTPTQTDVTFTVLRIDPATGSIEETASFVGSSYQSVIYMSANALYVTNSLQGDMTSFLYNFYTTDGVGLLPQTVIDRLATLQTYDLSGSTKFSEFTITINKYLQNLDRDQRLKLENNIQNKLSSYSQKNMRELEKTIITKVALPGLTVASTGAVPGRPLNQFSMDEYENNLRIATTVGGLGLVSTETANDVYVLDSALKTIGSVTSLGLGERIYSTRFIGDKGYVVTFKQVDPFYVLDLSSPTNPKIAGELKIPGFSSYLDPIAENLILGIGREDQRVKVSLFDVSDPNNPIEVSKYSLTEFWSDIESNYHAFLKDTRFEAFFLPGGQGEYIFSYKNNELNFERVISDINASRAIFIDDFMYIIGSDKILVLDENTWETTYEFDLN